MGLALFILSAAVGSNAAAYSPEELLRKVDAPTASISAPNSLQFLNPFAKVGVGYEKPEIGKNEHEFSVSLKPKGISEAMAYKRLSSALQRDIGISNKLYKSQSLFTAYTALISAALAKEQNASVADLRDLVGKSQKLSAIEARRDRADLKNVLKANSDLQKSLAEVIDTEAQLAGIRGFLAQHGLKLEDLETDDIVGAEEISSHIEKMPTQGVALTSQKVLSEVEVTRNDAEHSTAQRSKLLDDVKLSMEMDAKKEKTYKVAVSFNLPFLAAQDLGDYQDSLKAAEAEVKGRQALLEESLRSAGLAEVLKQKIALYRAMGEGRKWENQGLLRQDPALALDLQRSSVALRLTRASLLAEIRTLYVSLLLETERLAGDPGLNHLSRSKRKI